MRQVLLISAAVVMFAGSAQARLFGGGDCTGCLLHIQLLNPDDDDDEVLRPGPRGDESDAIEIGPRGPRWGDDGGIEPMPQGPSSDDEDE